VAKDKFYCEVNVGEMIKIFTLVSTPVTVCVSNTIHKHILNSVHKQISILCSNVKQMKPYCQEISVL
jgi:hypothetical protein